ncbi:MAG: hypothetical protein AXW16_00935 [Cycloclasticus sp. Phe_18]|jgi:hypothetical protein|nr:MAG: hypothetical protein AXW16_00935 [Cycloclasticus sp. Phe_18]MDF1689519.1 hypothetical protein [Cycloclasticus sp.]
MNVGVINQSALLGINNGLNQATSASQKLASSEQLNGEKSNQETAKDLVALQQAEQQVQISARVAQTAGDVIGSIIDIKA